MTQIRDATSSLTDADIVRILKAALNRNDTSDIFFPVFQAMIDASTQEIMGYEALYRLHIAPYGFVPPERFIRLAEKYHLMRDLGQMIQKRTFAAFYPLHQKNPHYSLCLNASIEELIQEDFAEQLIRSCDAYHIKRDAICVEITESLIIDTYEAMAKTLQKLKDAKIKVALDDFGKGYSSLTHLVELKLDIVKIDQYFSHKALDEPQYETFLSGLIFMLRALGVKVVIEGIETHAQAQFFTRLGVHILQGYYFHKPQLMEDLLKSHSS